MILSFHPIIEADRNIICAGRAPDGDDLAAIRQAAAVILPQGCYESLYRMVRNNCPHWFPNTDVRFDYPGKCGQVKLFDTLAAAHPRTAWYASVAAYRRRPWSGPFPAVVKLDWGGEGDTVYRVDHGAELSAAIDTVRRFEASGQCGFLIQEFVPSGNRSLRVVVVGSQLTSYWRIQSAAKVFGTAVAKGAHIDYSADPDLQEAARTEARRICAGTGLQMAGFDFLFGDQDLHSGRVRPLVLEINYFFGRRGLGGSEAYYRIVQKEVDRWLARLGFKR
jgi:ribosomal protein S6--L-glutamate ligase